MGGSQGKEENKSSGGDDQCMGNKRMRTIILGGLLAAFVALAFAYYQEGSDNAPSKQKDGFTLLLVAAVLIIIFAIGAIILNIITCLPLLNKICGFGLFAGGLAFFIGSFMIMSPSCDDVNGSFACSIGDIKKIYDARRATIFADGCLVGISSFLLGLDIFMDFLSDETKRLASNLGNLCFCGFLYTGAYASLADLTTDSKQKDAFATIAGGSSIYAIVALAYIILVVCSCCTCNVKDSCLFRVLFAVGLCIGGFVASSGFWAFADTFGSTSAEEKTKAYYVGLTVLVGGFCFAWAVDIMFDDIKGAREGNSKK